MVIFESKPRWLMAQVRVFSMGAKVQTENTKLSVPGAGSYEIKSKVSFQSGFVRAQE